MAGKQDMVNELVAEFGESHRKLIEDSMKWLDENAPKWGLSASINRESFIRNLLGKATNGKEEPGTRNEGEN